MMLALAAIAIMIKAFFVTVFLPQLLFQYVYANQELTAEPELIRYIPVGAFIVAAAYFIYALIMVIMNDMKIKKHTKELSLLSLEDGCCGNCGCDHDHDHEHHSSWLNDDEMTAVEKTSTKSMAKAMKKASSKKKTNSKK